jgi:hypothetical protein
MNLFVLTFFGIDYSIIRRSNRFYGYLITLHIINAGIRVLRHTKLCRLRTSIHGGIQAGFPVRTIILKTIGYISKKYLFHKISC